MTSMIKKIHIFLIILFVSMQNILAQTTYIHANNFTTRDGIASNVVNTIIQDRQGYLWIGTNQGLTRFDGHAFANFYVEENGESLVEGINHIVEDTLKNMLLMSGRDYRLLCFDLAKMRFIKSDGYKYPDEDVVEALESEFVARASKLGIQRGNITNRRHDLHYVKLSDGREIFTTIDNGFYIYDPESERLQHFSKYDEKAVIESDFINDVLLDRSGSVWLATTFAGVYQLDLDDRVLQYHDIAESAGNIRSFTQLSEGEIAVGDMEGNVFRFDLQTGAGRLLFHKDQRTYAMCADNKGRLWIGTRGGGL